MSFLILLPGRVSSSRFTKEVLICIAAAGLLGSLVFASLNHDTSKAPSLWPILLIWQSGMAVTLIGAAELRGARRESVFLDAPTTPRLAGDHTFLLALLGLFVAVAAWLIVMQVLQLRR